MGNLCENLVYFRKLHKKNQTQIAKLINKSQQSYAKYENGDTEPDISSLIVLSNYYGISIDTLIGSKPKEISLNNSENNYLGENQRAIQKLSEKLDDDDAAQIYNYMLFVLDQKEKKQENISMTWKYK